MLIGVVAPVYSEWDTAAAEALRVLMSPQWELHLGPEDVNGIPTPPHPFSHCYQAFFPTALSSPKATLLSQSKSMSPPQSDIPSPLAHQEEMSTHWYSPSSVSPGLYYFN